MNDIARFSLALVGTGLLVTFVRNASQPELYLLCGIALVLRFLGTKPAIMAVVVSSFHLLFYSASHLVIHDRGSQLLTFLGGAGLLFLVNRTRPTALGRDEESERLLRLRESEERLLLVIDTIPAMVWCANPDGGPAFVNRRMAEFVGVSEKEFVEVPTGTTGPFDRSIERWKQLLHPEDYEAARIVWIRALSTGESYRSIHRLRGANGIYRWFHSMGEPIRDQQGAITCWYGINIDIDDARKNEEKLSEAREQLTRTMQLAVIAELSASIAHEIKQPLAAIVANGQACQHWMAADPPNLKRIQLSVERIVRDSQATSDIVSRIRALFRKASPNKDLLDINEVIQEVLRLVREQARRRNVKIHTSLETSLPRVFADRVQVQQLVMNLVVNAIEAMSLEALEFRVLTATSRRGNDSNIEITLEDLGCGLPDETKIFEPFYTTKAQGMGMGLAICKTVAEQHGGTLSARLNPARGTTFTFTLPVGETFTSEPFKGNEGSANISTPPS